MDEGHMNKQTRVIIATLCMVAFQLQANQVKKVVIVGGGIAGLTAGIQAGHSKLEPTIITGRESAGLAKAELVGNWPGEVEISGAQLVDKIKKHAQKCGCKIKENDAVKIDLSTHPFTVQTDDGQTIKAKSLILATGTSPKKLCCPGEEKYFGKGVAICSTCDGPLYEDRPVVIVGSGSSALYEALALSKFTKKVTIVTKDRCLRAKESLQAKVRKLAHVNILMTTRVDAINGDDMGVTSVTLTDLNSGHQYQLPTDAVFVAIGIEPKTALIKGQVELDDKGFIKVTNNTKTSIPGVYAAGNICSTGPKQAITAAGAGCMAAMDAETFLQAGRSNKTSCP